VKKILFERSVNAYLPEIDAYIEYFNKISEYQAIDSLTLSDISYNDFDLIWKFMGSDYQKIDIPVVHEYASLSLGKLGKIKNFIKKNLNTKPSLRVFLNEEVKKEFGFNDNLPFVYRDMGIKECFFYPENEDKQYDFVYLGVISSERKIDFMLRNLIEKCKDMKSIILIGSPEDKIYSEFKSYRNITFVGRLDQKDIPEVASKAVYGINYIPNEYPYHLQTSTKLLEYLAMGLKIVTTGYYWVDKFERDTNMKFYKINPDLSNIMQCDNYEYVNQSVVQYKWDEVLSKSGILDKVNSII
jgi:glycosyltransferase involved in cell wall biosynthesis